MPRFLKSRWLFCLMAVAFLIGGLLCFMLYRASPRGMAEEALGVWSLPGSARDLDVAGDGTGGIPTRGYMEVSPEDLEQLLKARKYERRDDGPRPIHEEEYLRIRKLVQVTTCYYWESGSSYALLETDGSRSWVFFEYGAD